MTPFVTGFLSTAAQSLHKDVKTAGDFIEILAELLMREPMRDRLFVFN